MPNKYIPPCEEDMQEIAQVRERLIAARAASEISGPQLSAQMGRNPDFIRSLERCGDRGDRKIPVMSTLQLWAAGLGFRVEFEVENLWLFPQVDPSFMHLFRLSRPWGAHEEARKVAVASLRQWRMHRRLDVATVAPLLGVVAESLADWESEARDPLVSRMLVHARALDTRLRLKMFTRDEWIFG